jgi:hypothetical protein
MEQMNCGCFNNSLTGEYMCPDYITYCYMYFLLQRQKDNDGCVRFSLRERKLLINTHCHSDSRVSTQEMHEYAKVHISFDTDTA